MMKRASLLSLSQAVETAKKEASLLTSLKVSSVVGARRDEGSGLWYITMELLERKAIPDSMDLLGVYEVKLTDSGEVVDIERKGHRKRGDTH